MRTYVSVQALVSEDADQRQKLLDQILSFDDNDTATSAEFQSSRITLAAGASDVAVNFGGVTAASLVVIVAYDDVTVKFDGTGNDAIPVRMVPATAGGTVLSSLQRLDQPGLVIWRGLVNSIHFGNPSGSETADVFVAVVGNAT